MLTHDDVIRRPERLGDDGAADLGLAGASSWHAPILRVEGYAWVGLAPPETHRSIAGVEHGGGPKQEVHIGGDLLRNREGRGHGEVFQLTLRTLEWTARSEEAGVGGDGARSSAAVVGEERVATAIRSSLARFLVRGRRGGCGGARGTLQSTRGGFYRR